ncbi:hypothetical protein M0R72_15375 [Candidatus Pacearchaeota archaeon]|jgi:hypothetical protein|nr:hypothetical protein [Candidatus Pacearchaeota archaeon]
MTLVPRVAANASNTIANITPSRWQAFINSWGGYSNQTTMPPDAGTVIWNIAMQYPDLVGPIAYVIIFAMPFMMMWITHADMVPAAIVGIFFGLYIVFYIGDNFFAVGLLFIALALTVIVWSLAQKRG